MLSRREMVGKLAAGAAGAAVTLAVVGTRASAAVGPGAGPAANGAGPGDAALGSLPNLPVDGTTVGGKLPEEGLAAQSESPAKPPAAPPPWEMLRPLAQGSEVAHGWRIADLSAPLDGACVLTLQNERGRVRVHVCRNDGQPQGLVYTRQFDLVVMNGGQGDLRTDEGFGQAVAAVAHALAANEGTLVPAPVVTALLPHAERLQRFSAENEWSLR